VSLKLRIGFDIVHYNAPQAVGRLLDDLLRQNQSHCTLEVVIADNGPLASTLAQVKREYSGMPGVRFEAMPGNLGYYGAAQAALDTVWRDDLPQWVIVSNADIRVPDREFCSSLAAIRGPSFPVIAPAITSGITGRDQNPFKRRRPFAWTMHLRRLMRRSAVLSRLIEVQYSVKQNLRRAGLLGNRRPHSAKAMPVYSAHGSFIIFNKAYFERGGTFKAGAFLFGEEFFVAETCRRLGLDIVYHPALQVLHDEHAAIAPSRKIRAFEAAAVDYCARQYFPLWKRVRGSK
jgi:GT2 family glycosyltransferase